MHRRRVLCTRGRTLRRLLLLWEWRWCWGLHVLLQQRQWLLLLRLVFVRRWVLLHGAG
jgi:hypothetical protein